MTNKIIWIDVETTGLYPGEDTIIELAALYEERGNPSSRQIFHRYCKPVKKPANWDYISNLTNISWELLEEKGISSSQLSDEFISFLSTLMDGYDAKDKAVFAAYNASFDNQFVRKLFDPDAKQYFGSYFFSCSLDIMSTVALALYKNVLPQLFNYKNITLAEHFKINLKAHSAIEDIKASRQIQLKLEKLLNEK